MVTILPDQFRRLLREAEKTKGAIGVTQNGSVLFIDTGSEKFYIDAKGVNCSPQPLEE